MKMCTATLNSLTYAMKAQNTLSDSRIPTKIVKLDSSMTRHGCAYGIEFECNDLKDIRRILAAAHIPVKSYINGSGGTLI